MSFLDSLVNKQINTTQEKPEKLTLDLGQIPVVFLSFDEPNADSNFEHLYYNHPNKDLVHRVHGVKGFDAAHKAAAEKAGTERFFTVDADCLVDKNIWSKKLDLDKTTMTATFSWSSRNIVNGLVYGNGGIKLWYSDYVKKMKSHEAADRTDGQNNIDFCWDFENYKQMNSTYGTVLNNATPYQAFRAGFREGIKMGLDQGNKVPVTDFNHKMYPANYSRWLTWMTVGRDVENGAWSIYGARLGAYKLYVENFDHTMVADYDKFKELWQEIVVDTDNGRYLEDKSHKLLVDIRDNLKLPLVELDADQSVWFKHVYISPPKGFGWPAVLNCSALPLFGFRLPEWK